jgi:hypothetical protein
MDPSWARIIAAAQAGDTSIADRSTDFRLDHLSATEMDPSWARIIAAAQVNPHRITLIDGDRSKYRLVRQRHKNACSMHPHAERMHNGTLTRLTGL